MNPISIISKVVSDFNSSIHLVSKNISAYCVNPISVNDEIIEKNPYKLKNYSPADQVEEAFENFWEVDEWNTFINSVSENSPYKDLYTFLFWSGCRIGEALALNWDDIDFDRRKIKIYKTVSFKRYKEFDPITKDCPVTSNKTNRTRFIEMQDILYELLQKKHDKAENTDGYSNSWYVFGGIKQMRYATVRLNFNNDLLKTSCKEITLHGLRHSHASWLIYKSADDALIAERLGHSVQMLRTIYAHVYERRKKELVNILNDI